MGIKERVDRIGGPLSKEDLEAKLFKKGEELTWRQLKLLGELNALNYLVNLRDELIPPEQNPVIKKVLRYETIEPMSLVRRLLDPKDEDADYGTRWYLTDFTPEMEIEFTAKLLKRFGFDALIERPREEEHAIFSSRYWDELDASFDLCWAENDVGHKVSMGARLEPWISRGESLFRAYRPHRDYKYIKTQIFSAKILEILEDDIEEFLAHAFVLSKFDPEKEKEELEKIKKAMERSDVLVVPVLIGPSLEMQLILQELTASRMTEILKDADKVLKPLRGL